MARKNECLRAVLDELAAAGIKPDSIETRSNVIRVRWHAAGRDQYVDVGVSTHNHSNWRASHEARARVRRALRNGGQA
jgi:hypothetical protein